LKKREYKIISKSKNDINKIEQNEEKIRFSEIEDNEVSINEGLEID